jgi:hypothetical protein
MIAKFPSLGFAARFRLHIREGTRPRSFVGALRVGLSSNVGPNAYCVTSLAFMCAACKISIPVGLPASAFAPQPLSKGCCRDWAGSIENQIGEWKPGNTHHHADSGRES